MMHATESIVVNLIGIDHSSIGAGLSYFLCIVHLRCYQRPAVLLISHRASQYELLIIIHLVLTLIIRREIFPIKPTVYSMYLAAVFVFALCLCAR